MDPLLELAKLQTVYPDAELWDEGGQPLAYLPTLGFRSNGAMIVTSGLLCPRRHSSAGYPTRLFLRQEVSHPKQRNWTHHVVKGEGGWYSPSYDNVPATMPWLEILAAHLRGYA